MAESNAWTTVGPKKRDRRKGTSFASIDELYEYWTHGQFDFEIGMQMMREFYGIKYEAAQMIWYVLQRSRGTPELVARLVKADKIKDFDWYSVLRGEENEELKKYNL